MKKLFLVATAIVLAGCSSQTANPQPSDSPGGTVTVIAHDSFVMTEQQINDFKAATGITIELIQAGDAGTMVSSAILTAGSPSADVMFGIDNTLSAKAVNSGVFEPYESQASGTFKSEFQNLTAGGHLTPVDFGDVCVNFDKKFFAANSLAVPTSLADLTSKQYSGLLVAQDPGTSSPALHFYSQLSQRSVTNGQLTGNNFVQIMSKLRVRGAMRTSATSLPVEVTAHIHWLFPMRPAQPLKRFMPKQSFPKSVLVP